MLKLANATYLRKNNKKKNRQILLLNNYYYYTTNSIANQNAGFTLDH